MIRTGRDREHWGGEGGEQSRGGGKRQGGEESGEGTNGKARHGTAQHNKSGRRKRYSIENATSSEVWG
eukprot:2594904-Pyramimonas_sp.AAC.1